MSSSKIKIPAIFFRSNDQPSPIRCTNRQLNIKCCIEYQLCIHVMSTETTRSFYESKRQQFTVWRQRRENANTTSMTKHQKKNFNVWWTNQDNSNPFNSPLSRTIQVNWYQKNTPSLTAYLSVLSNIFNLYFLHLHLVSLSGGCYGL